MTTTGYCAGLEKLAVMKSLLSETEWNDYRADARLGWRLAHQCWPGPDSRSADWLQTPGSLTRRLQSISDGTFNVRVISEGWVCRTVTGSGLSNSVATKQMMWSRQVVLRGLGEDWVAAHSLIPMSSLKGRQRRLIHLGNKPLGGFLFKQPSLRRGEPEICQIDAVWGRRTLFFLQERPLLVAEFFLPDLIRRTQQSTRDGLLYAKR
ncbi:MAG: chorismate lyase [Pseudohongiella sp.]|nr:chorismate lyase [Pseudohongiella sp.]MDP2127989.1 chorismate lyase [Pseudohongiella sp.]